MNNRAAFPVNMWFLTWKKYLFIGNNAKLMFDDWCSNKQGIYLSYYGQTGTDTNV
jgi:hypothetical protein